MGRFNAAFMEKNKANQNSTQAPIDSAPVSDTGVESEVPNSVIESEESTTNEIIDSISDEDNTDNSDVINDVQQPQEPNGNEFARNSDKVFRKIDVDSIEFAEDNPFRKNDKTEFGQEELEELANNIAVFGLLHPLLVNSTNGRYVLISGERRLRAVKKLGWKQVDCIITEVDDSVLERGMLNSANTEVRRTIKPFEMFGYIYELLNIYKTLSSESTSAGIGKDKYQYVANSLSISKRQLFKYTNIMKNLDILTSEEKEWLENGELSINRAYEIIKSRNNGTEGRDIHNHNEPETKPATDGEKTEDTTTSANPTTDNVVETDDDMDNDITETEEISEEEQSFEGSNDNGNSEPSEIEDEPVDESEDVSSNDTSVSAAEQTPVPVDNKELLEALFNPTDGDFEIYTAVSLITKREIFGVPCVVGDKAYIVFPSRITTKFRDGSDNKVVDIKTAFYEVDKDSIKKKGE